MNLSKAEIKAILSAAADHDESSSQPWAGEVQHMLIALADYEFQPGRRAPLAKLCEAGARYGWKDLEAAAGPNLLTNVSPRAKASLRRDLRRSLEELTRPCLELERKSFGLAMDSIGLMTAPPDSTLAERMFLRDKPSDRIFSLFKKFPVLARLWRQTISQWRKQVLESLVRLEADRRVLSQAFFDGRPIGKIIDARSGLSDRHNSGRTVMRLNFEAGSIIYKPRSGAGELEWFSLLTWMNENSFRPKLRAARVLPRGSYCWMEDIEAAPCKNEAGARRFFQRMGGLIGAAHLLKAVDCHRDNLIASGEYPILVDVDALWHVSPVTKTQAVSDVLYRTGFFPDANRRGLQSRSSALGRGTTGSHRARVAGRPLEAAAYTQEVVTGFRRAWGCILGTRKGRAALAARIRRIRSQERRWIYWATETYARIRRASLQPAAMRSGIERGLLLTRLCTENRVTSAPVEAEVRALQQLDIPYFIRKSYERMPLEKRTVPLELIKAIPDALQF